MIELYQGDCIPIMADLSGPYDMILADLPYGTTQCRWDIVIPFEPLWAQYKRLIKKRGAVVLFGSQPFTSALVMSNVEWFAYTWYWKKERGTGFATSGKQPLKSIEEICVFYQSGVVYNPQMKKLDKPYRHVLPRSDSPSGGKATLSSIKTQEKQYKIYTHSTPHTLLEFSRDNGCKGQHPTQKPAALLEYLIRTYTNEGETVLDNVFGSCSTGVACINTGRNFVGIEQDEGYFKIGQERIAKAQSEHVQLELGAQ